MCFLRVEISVLLVLSAFGSIVRAAGDTTLTASPLATTEVTSALTTTSSPASIPSSTKSPAETTTPEALPLCVDLSVMPNIDLLALSGTWYELARKGYGTFVQNLQCLEMEISYMNGTAMVFQTYAEDLQLIHNQTVYEYIVEYNKMNPSDYNITKTNYNYLPLPIYKILDTDYENYLVVCSYIEVWERSAAAFVYFRDRSTPDDVVYAAVDKAATKYGDFQNMNLVYQGPSCNSTQARAQLTSQMAVLLFAICLLKLIRK